MTSPSCTVPSQFETQVPGPIQPDGQRLIQTQIKNRDILVTYQSPIYDLDYNVFRGKKITELEKNLTPINLQFKIFYINGNIPELDPIRFPGKYQALYNKLCLFSTMEIKRYTTIQGNQVEKKTIFGSPVDQTNDLGEDSTAQNQILDGLFNKLAYYNAFDTPPSSFAIDNPTAFFKLRISYVFTKIPTTEEEKKAAQDAAARRAAALANTGYVPGAAVPPGSYLPGSIATGGYSPRLVNNTGSLSGVPNNIGYSLSPINNVVYPLNTAYPPNFVPSATYPINSVANLYSPPASVTYYPTLQSNVLHATPSRY